MKEALKVSLSGVRGVVGDSFTPQLAASFAQAFGTFVGRGPVVIGRDTRPSGAMLEYAVIAGLQSVGCQPLLAGVLPTPSLLYLTKTLGARGGIAITASHNPAPWNALKFVGPTGLFLSELRAEELFDIYHQQEFPLVAEADIPAAELRPEAVEPHLQRVQQYVDSAGIRARRFKVAVDCCNGVGAVHTARFLRERLGCEVVPVFDAPSGAFEREPEPLPEHLGALCAAVVRHGCAIGFAQDPDGDRLALVDEHGLPLGEDLTLALAVQQVLAAHAKGPVVVNLNTSKAVEQVARRLGSEVHRTRIGEINVCEAMLALGAPVGGENNGGVIIPAIHPCRDSYGGMAVILELLAMSGQSVSALRAALPYFHLVKEKWRIRTEQAPAILRALRRRYAGEKLILLDGVYIDRGDRWAHVRRSNTEPVMRVTVEAPSQGEATQWAAELRAAIEEAMG